MNIGEIITVDCANGEGIRVSLFVSGCTLHCRGCFNEKTWDFSFGRLWTPELEQFLLEELAKPYYTGLTILGGEPFEKQNQPAVAELVERVKRELPERTIWIYTGFTYDRDLISGGCRYTEDTDRILDGIDVLVDGRFIAEKRNLMLKFRGSENQRIICMKETRKSGKVCLSSLN